MEEAKKGFIKHLGGLTFKKINENNYEFSAKVQDMHLNTGGIAHGGYLATIADAGMGTAAHVVVTNKRCVTINLDLKFISAGKIGDLLVGKVAKVEKNRFFVLPFVDFENIDYLQIVTSK